MCADHFANYKLQITHYKFINPNSQFTTKFMTMRNCDL